jgi:hypothetical protein
LSISGDFAVKSLFAAFCRSFQLGNLEQRLSFIAGTKASLNARMRELNRLRDQVKKAELSAGKVRLLSRNSAPACVNFTWVPLSCSHSQPRSIASFRPAQNSAWRFSHSTLVSMRT